MLAHKAMDFLTHVSELRLIVGLIQPPGVPWKALGLASSERRAVQVEVTAVNGIIAHVYLMIQTHNPAIHS